MINLFLVTAEYHQRNSRIKLEPRVAAVQAAKSLPGEFKYTRQHLAFHAFEVFVKRFFWVVVNGDYSRIGKYGAVVIHCFFSPIFKPQVGDDFSLQFNTPLRRFACILEENGKPMRLCTSSKASKRIFLIERIE